MHPVHTFSPYFRKIHSSIFPSMPRSCEWCLPLRFSDYNFICISHLSHAFYMPRPSHPWLDHPNDAERLEIYCSQGWQQNGRSVYGTTKVVPVLN